MTNEQLDALAKQSGAYKHGRAGWLFEPRELAAFAAALASQGDAAYLSGWDSHAAACRAAGCAIAAPKLASPITAETGNPASAEASGITRESGADSDPFDECECGYGCPPNCGCRYSDPEPASDTAAGAVTDADALAFHHAITDGAIGQDDLDEIKIGLRAFLAGRSAATPPAATQVPRDERAAFEAWIRKDAGDLSTFGTPPNRHYSNSAVNNAWTGWMARASLAAAQVEQPEAPHLRGRESDDYYRGWKQGAKFGASVGHEIDSGGIHPWGEPAMIGVQEEGDRIRSERATAALRTPAAPSRSPHDAFVSGAAWKMANPDASIRELREAADWWVGTPAAPEAGAQVPSDPYREHLAQQAENIEQERLQRALTLMGAACAGSGQEGFSARLAENVNRLTLAIVTHFRTPAAPEAGRVPTDAEIEAAWWSRGTEPDGGNLAGGCTFDGWKRAVRWALSHGEAGSDSTDAARYRCIRNAPYSDRHGDLYAMCFQGDGDVPLKGAELDAAADAAISGSGKGQA